MTSREIAHYRLSSQMLVNPACKSPGEVVAAMGAIQAQDYLNSLWAIGVRLASARESVIEKAIADRKIIRTWPMRGTLHFVAPGDVHWMLEHLAPRMITTAARRHRELELNDTVFAKSRKIFVRALRGGKMLTRPALMALLECAKITTTSQRGYHILWRLALDRFICFGPREGKQHTFVLLDEWIPRSRRRSRNEALADLALRYFTSHGPATVEDLSWWIGLKKSEAVEIVDSIATQLSSFTTNGSTYWLSNPTPKPRERLDSIHLLPSFDELLIGYTDRSAAVAPQHLQKVIPGANGMFMPVVVKAGRVIGTWKRTLTGKHSVALTVEPFTVFSKSDLRGWTTAAKRYAEFLETKVELV